MIKLAVRNIKFLNFIYKIPLIRHFFIYRVTDNFEKINNPAVLEKLYTDIYTTNKTSKKTNSNRFAKLDQTCLKYLYSNEILSIHDVAVSNGITSVEFYLLLKEKAIDFNLYVSDKFARFNLKKGIFKRFFDLEHHFIFGYWGPFFACDKNIFFPLTMLLYYFLKKIPNNKEYNTSVLFFHPKLIQLINSYHVKYIDYDIFKTKTDQKFDFIRCMNILNINYFDRKLIKNALLNLAFSMKENGILLMGRTNANNINNATFFKKQSNKLIHLEDFNNGSEIKTIILDLDLDEIQVI